MKLKKLLYLALSLGIYAILIAYLGPSNALDLLKEMSPTLLLLSILFMILSILVEFMRWVYYFGALKVKMAWKGMFLIFLSGFALDFMPFKSGQFMRYYLLKKKRVSYNKSIAVHVISNLSDLAMFLIFSVPILFFIGHADLFYISIALISLFYLLLGYPKLYLALIRRLKKMLGWRLIDELEKGISYAGDLIRFKSVLIMFLMTFIMVILFGLSFAFIAINYNIPVILSFSIYSLSLIIGAISMVPGGLGVVEISGVSMLSLVMDPSKAAFFIITVRLVTHWFSVGLGWISLYLLKIKKQK